MKHSCGAEFDMKLPANTRSEKVKQSQIDWKVYPACGHFRDDHGDDDRDLINVSI